MFLLGWFRRIENFLFVPRCVICRKDGKILCSDHLISLELFKVSFWVGDLEIWASFSYKQPLVRRILESFKYKGIRELGFFMASEMIVFDKGENILIVPIPVSYTHLTLPTTPYV